MATVLMIVWLLSAAVLVAVTSVRPHHSRLSRYELQRRAAAGDRRAKADYEYLQDQAGLAGMRRLMAYLSLVLGSYCVTAALGIGWGMSLTVILIVVHPAVGRLKVVAWMGRRAYSPQEPRLRRLLHAAPWLGACVRDDTLAAGSWQVGSREELAHLIDQATTYLGDGERQLLLHGLSFESLTVGEVMTPASKVVTVPRRELLGPLVLDDLHKTGHGVFPVVEGDLSHIVGVLSIEGFLTLDDKRSLTAEKAMTAHVVYVRDTASVRTALQRFLQSHQHVLMVEDEQGAVVGLVTLYDCLTRLFGH